MSDPNILTEIHLADEDATIALANQLATLINTGDLILLSGELGAGKTTFARALIRALVKDENLEVPSPTFLLALPYAIKGVSILHADLYRLTDPRERDELGFDDDPDTIILVEWPERDPTLAADADLIISLKMKANESGRVAQIEVRRDLLRKDAVHDRLQHALRQYR